MISDVKGKVSQVTPVVTADGSLDYIKMTKLGALFTADWKFQLAAAGYVYQTHVGTLTAGADVALVAGGGAGTTVDSDQPEFAIGVDAGYYLIPIEINVDCDIDCDADNEYGEIVAFGDRTQAPPTSNASGTALTPTNLLDGSLTFPGRAWSTATGDVTDPVMSELIGFEYFSTADNGTAASALPQKLSMRHNPLYPRILQGPCQIVVCWGGTAQVNGIANIIVAMVPTNFMA